MHQLNTTLTYQIGHTMNYPNNQVEKDAFITDQWGMRAITNNPSSYMYFIDADHPVLTSIYDIYKGASALSMPDSFTLANYAPELNWYVRDVLHLMNEDIELSPQLCRTLFAEDTTSVQTLLSPLNMYFFFDQYENSGNLAAISKRFSVDGSTLSDSMVKGIYQYLQFLVDKQVDQGNFGGDYNEHSAFGSLFSMAMAKSYAVISN